MKRVYLLLRNNCQTGPYTIGELLQQQLRPSDLVWVEGSSQAWSYPAELPELNGFFEGNKEDKQIRPVQPPGSLTKDEIEQWAEELRQRALSTPKIYIPAAADEDTAHIEALRAMARERIEFIDHRKKESPAFEWLSAAMVMLVVVGSVYGGASFFNARTNLPVVAHKAATVDNHAAKVLATPIPQPVAAVYEERQDTVAAPAVVKQKPVVVPRRKKINVEALPATAIERIPLPSHKEGSPSSSSVPGLLDESQKETLIEPEPRTIVTEEPVEKKKSGLFRGLFKKKKKAEERGAEQEVKAVESQGD